MRLAFLLLIAACGGSKTSEVPVATPPKQTQEVVPADVAGYWTGDWGQLVLGERNGKVVGAYSHDEGVIVGSLQAGVLIGWWCEVPSRKPSKDAGDVEMKFVTIDGKRSIDGRWRYGSEGEWREDWDISWDAGTPDPALVKRLDSATTDCVK